MKFAKIHNNNSDPHVSVDVQDLNMIRQLWKGLIILCRKGLGQAVINQ